MIILSHRGYWKTAAEKNTVTAFARAFALGFGTETDLRDCCGRLVIAHDPPDAQALPADVFFELYRGIGRDLPLALNVKADGLQRLIKEALERHGITQYFLFDMAIPDARHCISQGLKVFTRQSEWEPQPSFYEHAEGVWMDGFFGDWMDEDHIGGHLAAGKKVCLVSPDLHRRDHRPFWDRLARMPFLADPRLMLCTDVPEEARAALQARGG